MSLDMGQYPSVSRAEQTTSYTGGSDYCQKGGLGSVQHIIPTNNLFLDTYRIVKNFLLMYNK